MSSQRLDQLLADELARRAESNLLRRRRVIDPRATAQAPGPTDPSQPPLVNFASNDYLGLTHHPRVINAARIALDRYGAGAGASALVTGYSPEHARAEQAIANWKAVEAAIYLPSGYQAAHAAIGTLAALSDRTPVRFLLDKLAHASLVDAVRASGCAFRIFPHNHLEKLERLLVDAPANELQVVVTESIFSMDGDAADLPGLARLKQAYGFTLLLDEAHGSGVYGQSGAGYAHEVGLAPIVDIGIATLSKAAGVAGGAVYSSRLFCDAITNWGRAYIYSTAVPPHIVASAAESIAVMHDQPELQHRVRLLAARVRTQLGLMGIQVPPGDSPIVPILLGTEQAAMHASAQLEADGLRVVAIRPPTVPRGTSRLRVTLSSAHSDAEVERLLASLAKIAASPPPS